MNKEQIEKLKELAQAATPGPWMVWPTTADNGEYTGLEIMTHDGGALVTEETHPNDDDALFIAAANPAAILELIAIAERTTAPVSLTDGQIEALAVKHESFGFGQAGKKSKLSIHGFEPEGLREFARALLAAAPAPIQQEPVLWVESEPNIRDKDASYAINSLCHTVVYHIKKPDTTNPVWPLYAATPARVGTVGGDAARDVLAERERQKQQEGWTPEHDDQYKNDELSCAAACYTMANNRATSDCIPDLWMWPEEWWKPTTERRNLVKAGALILAEIERLDRAAMREQP